MADLAKDKYSVLKTLLHELSKTFIVRDGLGRIWKVYSAKSDALNNDPCILTEYIYTTPTSSDIAGEKEVNAQWDSTWDAGFTI